MRGLQFLIFITVFFSIYIAGNSYIFIRGWQALPSQTLFRVIYSVLFAFLSLSFIIGEVTEKTGAVEDSKFLIVTGSTWLAFMLYTVLILLVIDSVRALNLLFHFLPSTEAMISSNIPLKLMAATIISVAVILVAGAVMASNPVVRTVDITIPKKGGIENSLSIVIASDVHLGNIVGRKKFSHLVDTINRIEPDVVLFPGDFFDETLAPVVKDNMGGLVESIRAKYGVYASTGNHEYIGGIDDAVNFMKKHKITVLRDEAVEINGSVLLAGREDRSIDRFTDKKRKSVGEILKDNKNGRAVILMDHQPSSIGESVKNGVDLHLSGHTHNGQLWPFNYITNAIFKVPCGYSRDGNTHIYVSKGYGTWGPPVRTTGRPEIVLLHIRFSE